MSLVMPKSTRTHKHKRTQTKSKKVKQKTVTSFDRNAFKFFLTSWCNLSGFVFHTVVLFTGIITLKTALHSLPSLRVFSHLWFVYSGPNPLISL